MKDLIIPQTYECTSSGFNRIDISLDVLLTIDPENSWCDNPTPRFPVFAKLWANGITCATTDCDMCIFNGKNTEERIGYLESLRLKDKFEKLLEE